MGSEDATWVFESRMPRDPEGEWPEHYDGFIVSNKQVAPPSPFPSAYEVELSGRNPGRLNKQPKSHCILTELAVPSSWFVSYSCLPFLIYMWCRRYLSLCLLFLKLLFSKRMQSVRLTYSPCTLFQSTSPRRIKECQVTGGAILSINISERDEGKIFRCLIKRPGHWFVELAATALPIILRKCIVCLFSSLQQLYEKITDKALPPHVAFYWQWQPLNVWRLTSIVNTSSKWWPVFLIITQIMFSPLLLLLLLL